MAIFTDVKSRYNEKIYSRWIVSKKYGTKFD